jgi:succinate dehydrogenase flavin-adding protein (antitoxin of CptAB toxin-antitoxin module)
MPRDLTAQYHSQLMKILETLKSHLKEKSQLEALLKEEDRKIWQIITKIAEYVEKKESLKSVSATPAKKKQVSRTGKRNVGKRSRG